MRWWGKWSVMLLLMVGVSCSLRDYMNQPVLRDVYDGPTIVLLQPSPTGFYSGKVWVIADIMEKDGLGTIEIRYEGGTERISTGGVGFYRLEREIRFSRAGRKTIELKAYNRRGIARSASVDITVYGPSITITNDFVQEGYLYTSATSLHIGGYLWEGPTNIERVYVRIQRGSLTTEYSASFLSGAWSATVPLSRNEDVVIVACAQDMSGVVGESKSFIVYQDSQGPTLEVIRPTNSQREATMVAFEGRVWDDKAGAWRIIGSIDNWASTFTNEMSSYLGNRGEVGFGFYRWLSPGVYTIRLYAEDFLGNRSATNVIVNVNVDGMFPYAYVTGPSSWWSTNVTSFAFYGEYANVSRLEYSLNGGSWTEVTQYASGNWTNSALSYLPNRENTLRLRAIAGSYTNVSLLYRFLIDTFPPQLERYEINGISVANNEIRVIRNEAWIYRNILLTDNLTGIRWKFDILKGKWGHGGTSYQEEINTNQWLGTRYEDRGERTFIYGAVITNIIVVWDRAGNSNSFTRLLEVYPAIYVTPGASSSGIGIASDPLPAYEGVEKARQLGVRIVCFAEGTNNLTGTLKPGDNMLLRGGYLPTFEGWSGTPSFLRYMNNTAVLLSGVERVYFDKIGIVESGSPGKVPFVVRESSFFFLNGIFARNRGTNVLFIESSVGYLENSLFVANTNSQSVVHVAGSGYYGVDNVYTNNFLSSPLGIAAQLWLNHGWAFISNHTFDTFNVVGGGTAMVSHTYATNVEDFLVQNSVFGSISSSGVVTNASLILIGNMPRTSIVSNIFSGVSTFLLAKDKGILNYQLKRNLVSTNRYSYLWVELPELTNRIASNEFIHLNNPTRTKATLDSTDNVTSP